MLFCKGTSANIQVLSDIFVRYAQISGQLINPQKSTIYAGSMSHSRILNVSNSLGFGIGTIPFLYLGVPFFKGKPKAIHFQPLVDRIKIKLASWKASLLSFAGRLELIRSVVQGMMIYSISIYSWPVNLIKELDKYMRNFLWSGDRKLVIVSWNTVCTPIDEGGLGLRSLSKINEASNLKLCWEMMHSDNLWATFLRSRVKRGNKFIGYHIFSSLWSGIKSQAHTINEISMWLLGDGESINFWNYNWCGTPLVDLFNIPSQLHINLHSTVSQYIHSSQWFIPEDLQQNFPALMAHINQITIPIVQKEDRLIWKNNASGELTLKDAYLFSLSCWSKKKLG